MSARMGIFQETLYKQFGKHSKEALFYNVSNFLNLGKTKSTESSYVISNEIHVFLMSLKDQVLLIGY